MFAVFVRYAGLFHLLCGSVQLFQTFLCIADGLPQKFLLLTEELCILRIHPQKFVYIPQFVLGLFKTFV